MIIMSVNQVLELDYDSRKTREEGMMCPESSYSLFAFPTPSVALLRITRRYPDAEAH